MMTILKRAVCVHLFLFSFATMAYCDEVVLKSGMIVEGEATVKGNMWVQVQLSGEKRTVDYPIENVASINGEDPNAVLKAKETAAVKADTSLSPKTVILHLKNGKSLQGILIEENDYFLRIRPEGEKSVKEVLWENLSSIEGVDENRIENARMNEAAYSRNILTLDPGERKALRKTIDLSEAQEQKVIEESVEKETKEHKVLSFFGRDNPRTDLEMGMEVSRITYDEPDTMQENGYMKSIYAKFTYWLNKDGKKAKRGDFWKERDKFTFLQMDTRYGWGDVDYDSSGTGEMDDVHDYMLEVRGLIGNEWRVKESLTLVPFAGMGYRYLNDDLDGTSTTGDWGYQRESRYYYLPVGFTTRFQAKNNWLVAFTAEYDYFIKGQQKSHLEDGGYSIQDSVTKIWYVRDTLENDQHKGYGLRGSLRAMHKDKTVDLFLEFFVRYWKLGQSDATQITSNGGSLLWYLNDGITPYTGVEPKNQSTEYGVRFGFLF